MKKAEKEGKQDMTGHEIRRWAWQKWRENAGYMLLANLLTMIPACLPEVQARLGIMDDPALLIVERYVGCVLILGHVLMILTLIRDGNRDLSLLLAPLRDKKALLLALVLTGWNLVKDWINAWTGNMKLIKILFSIFCIVLSIFFFTLRYDLFLFSKRSPRELFEKSIAVGKQNFGDIFLFQLICAVIFIVPLFLLGLFGTIFPVGIILMVAYSVLCSCYTDMAVARMAMEVSGVGHQAKKCPSVSQNGGKTEHRKAKKR